MTPQIGDTRRNPAGGLIFGDPLRPSSSTTFVASSSLLDYHQNSIREVHSGFTMASKAEQSPPTLPSARFWRYTALLFLVAFGPILLYIAYVSVTGDHSFEQHVINYVNEFLILHIAFCIMFIVGVIRLIRYWWWLQTFDF